MKIQFIITGIVMLVMVFFKTSSGYVVNDLVATYQNGQVFLTWKNPNQTNLQYNVYRSTSKFTESSKITSSKYLGFVRDSSSKNFYWSIVTDTSVFFRITDGGEPLSANKGVYVSTCTSNKNYYYAVTITNLSTGIEDKTITPSENSLISAITEIKTEPQPVYQDSIVDFRGDVKQHYVHFGNNQETSLYPAMVNVGSYGFNFYLVKRGTATSYPLIMFFEGTEMDQTKVMWDMDSSITNCYILGVNDWIPVKFSDGTFGTTTSYAGYHENFNMYTDQNPIPTSGIIKTYTQKRLMEEEEWVVSHFPIDKNKIYLKGRSHNGYGAVLTSILNPEKFAVVYGIVEPNGVTDATDINKQMWGVFDTKLKCDVIKYGTTDTLIFRELAATIKMIGINKQRSLPLLFDIHGKIDPVVIWNATRTGIYDSLEANHYGGTWFWDGRDHDSTGAKFLDSETEPDYFRYVLNQSYPAFSNCTINQDPGNGSPVEGDAYGAINGYLDWKDSTDKSCSFSMNINVKDFYAGGVLDPEQYSKCTTDITFRRLQQFIPSIGSTITWKNYDVSHTKIQSGSFTYKGGLITLTGIKINKTGNLIKLKIEGCSSRTEEDSEESSLLNHDLYFTRSVNGSVAHLSSLTREHATVSVFDLLGRRVSQKGVELESGEDEFQIELPSRGLYLIRVTAETFEVSGKVFY